MGASDRYLFTTMWREEWRLHAELFGGGRFSTFPVVVLGLTAVAGIGLTTTGVDIGTVETGIRALALLFGLYAGTAGFVGTDALSDLFGGLSLVLSTVETLPLSPSRLLGLFLVKDGLFYAAVFLLPMALGTTPLALAAAGTETGWGTVTVSVAMLWIETTALFLLGMAVTVAAIAGRTRGLPRTTLLSGVGAVGVAGWYAGADRTLFVAPTPAVTAATLVAASVLAGAALAVYDPGYRPPARTRAARFGDYADRIGDGDGLVTKSLLDLARSSGGLWKPVVSAGILLAVVAGLIQLVERIVGVDPAPGAFFGVVLALSAFTTYNWLTSVDSLDSYRILPVRIAAVFRAKRRAFAVVGVPVALAAYAVALALYPTTLADALLGALWLLAGSVYFFGVTVYLAGFDPNEFLFDPVRFGSFGAAVALVVVPALVGSFLPASGLVPNWGSVAAVGGALAVGAVGSLLTHRAGPRWAERLRSA